MIQRLMQQLLESDKYAERKGAAYGLAGLVKGLGILSLKQQEMMAALTDAIQDKKNFRRREGGSPEPGADGTRSGCPRTHAAEKGRAGGTGLHFALFLSGTAWAAPQASAMPGRPLCCRAAPQPFLFPCFRLRSP